MLKRILFLLTASLVATNFVASIAESKKMKADSVNAKVAQLSPGIYDVPVIVSPSLESRKDEFRQDFIKAQTRLREFAQENGWGELMNVPFVKQIEIYDSKEGWDNRLRGMFPKEAPAEIPKTYSAAIEQDVFFAVSPEVYFANFPDGKDEPDAYVKLMTHELAHRLHVRICKGKENKMGPIWFFEGFAVYAADQLNNKRPKLSNADIWSIVKVKERGSYLKYNVVFRHFLGDTPLPEYVKKAGEPGFRSWLKRTEKTEKKQS